MGDLFWLSDAQWAAIEPLLPKNQPGPRRVDDRRVLSGVFHVLKAKCRWRDCPREYGSFTTIYNRFSRWSEKPFWPDILKALKSSGGLNEAGGDEDLNLKTKGEPRKKKTTSPARRLSTYFTVENSRVEVIHGSFSTSFFIFFGEPVSVQVSVPSRPEQNPESPAMAERRLNAAYVLMSAAAALLK